MYAVIVTGGKQYRVAEGQLLKVEKLTADVGQAVNFDQILMVVNGQDIKIGAPVVKGGKVTAEVVEHGRGKKIRIVKHRRRKHSHKEMGHRQDFTKIQIKSIQV